jgi:hypothetical protein
LKHHGKRCFESDQFILSKPLKPIDLTNLWWLDNPPLSISHCLFC